jgi:mono/diheme cytochrome c family protein
MNTCLKTLLTLAILLLINPSLKSADPGEAGEDVIRKGRYLAMGVAMCIDCHSPKLDNGLLDSGRILMGADITVAPIKPVADWVSYAPAISGLPNYSDEEVVEMLTTGTVGNTYLRPPMPVYEMTVEDAEAIVAYLRSLPPPDAP